MSIYRWRDSVPAPLNGSEMKLKYICLSSPDGESQPNGGINTKLPNNTPSDITVRLLYVLSQESVKNWSIINVYFDMQWLYAWLLMLMIEFIQCGMRENV